MFDDDFHLEEPPAKRRRFVPQHNPLPSQEDESPSASNIQTRTPSLVSDSGTHQSRSDSGYGISIAESCELGVNETSQENVHSADSDARLWGDDAPLDSFNNEFNSRPLDDSADLSIDKPEVISPSSPGPILQQTNEAPAAHPKPDFSVPDLKINLPSKRRIGNTATKMPKGFAAKRMSKIDAIKIGAPVGSFPNMRQVDTTTGSASFGEQKTPSSEKPQAQKSSTSSSDRQNIMDFPLPLAMSIALTEPAMRAATLATIYKVQSVMLHDPERPSQPPFKTAFVELLENFYKKFQTQQDLRETVITFLLEKLEKRTDEPKAVRTTLKWKTLEDDLANMEQAMKDIHDPKVEKQKSALATGSEIVKRNASHIKELIAGKPHLKSLEARIRSQSKQIAGLATKCQELQLHEQYLGAIATSRHTTAPAPVRMPPPMPSTFTPFEQLPDDLVKQPRRLYRTTEPQLNTAWMCAFTTEESGEHCGAIMRSWIHHQQRGHKLWISHMTCVKCERVHKSLAFKYFLHESEVIQLGGITRGRAKQDDSPKLVDNPAKNNHQPVQVVTPSSDLQQASSTSHSLTLPQAPSATHQTTDPQRKASHLPQTPSTAPKSHAPEVGPSTQQPRWAPITHPEKQLPKTKSRNETTETAPQTQLHPAISDRRRGSTSKPPAQHRPINDSPQMEARRRPSGGLNILTPTFPHNAGPERAAPVGFYDQPQHQYNQSAYDQTRHYGQYYYHEVPREFYSREPQQGSYGYHQSYPPPPHVSPYSPYPEQPYQQTPQQQQDYEQTSQQYQYATAHYGRVSRPLEQAPQQYYHVAGYYRRRSSQPSAYPPQQQQPVSSTAQTNLGMPPTQGLALAPACPTAPTPKSAIRATPPAQRLKRPMPMDAEVIVLDPETPSSLSDNSQGPPSKKPKLNKPTVIKDNPRKPRRTSFAPIPKQTGDTLRFLMKGTERPWMRNGGLSETAVELDREGDSPSADSVDGDGEMRAEPPPAVNERVPSITKKTVKRTTKVAKAVEEHAGESVRPPTKSASKKRARKPKKVAASVKEPTVEEYIIVETPADSSTEIDAEGDNDSLFGEPEERADRELTDEMADEWARELEAEMEMTPDVVEESEESEEE